MRFNLGYISSSFKSSLFLTIFTLLIVLPHSAYGIKFELPASRYPVPKCIWNTAHEHALIIVTANVGPGAKQRIDISVVDGSQHKNVYLSKRDINGETRLAVTSHAHGDVGVCFTNTLDSSKSAITRTLNFWLSLILSSFTAASSSEAGKSVRIIDLDVDIGADAVDYK